MMVFQQLSEYIIPIYKRKKFCTVESHDIARSNAAIPLGFINLEDIDPKSNGVQCRQVRSLKNYVMEFTLTPTLNTL
jgi:hypothetical protein